jgi:hypothetical protein
LRTIRALSLEGAKSRRRALLRRRRAPHLSLNSENQIVEPDPFAIWKADDECVS